MKNNLYKLLVVLVLFALTACQPGSPMPTQRPAVDFFKDQPDRWLSVQAPAGWIAGLGSAGVPSVIVTNDWKTYSGNTTTKRAIGITITPLTDKGSAQQVLQIVMKRLTKMLTTPVGKVRLEQVGGQNYASVEYNGKSAQEDNKPAYYFLTIISTDQRSVLVFSSVDMDQIEMTRPAYQSTIRTVILH